MGIIELFIIAVGLSMDAFAISICKGLTLQKMNWKNAGIAGLYFGSFQGFMPFIGYLLGWRFKDMITQVDHWIAFALLAFIGASMIKESREEAEKMNTAFDIKTMLPLAIATSIDALAVGVGFAFLNVAIIPAIILIGCITFVFSFVGIRIGNVFGVKYKSHAELAGGVILILMGLKILLEHLNVL